MVMKRKISFTVRLPSSVKPRLDHSPPIFLLCSQRWFSFRYNSLGRVPNTAVCRFPTRRVEDLPPYQATKEQHLLRYARIFEEGRVVCFLPTTYKRVIDRQAGTIAKWRNLPHAGEQNEVFFSALE